MDNLPPEFMALADPERYAITTFFERAWFAVVHSGNKEAPPAVRAFLLAASTHNCRALIQAIDAEVGRRNANNSDPDQKTKVPPLTGRELLKQVADHDLHGIPIPTCQEGITLTSQMASKKPSKLTSSHGVAVQIQFDGPQPKVKLSPKDQKHGKYNPGDGIPYHCQNGELFVHWRGKNLHLCSEIKKFLKAAKKCVDALYPPPDAST